MASVGWTVEAVDRFLLQHPVDTGGARRAWRATITQEDDGDVFFRVKAPYWFQNPGVVRDVLQMALDAHKVGADVYLRDNSFEFVFYISVCDPD